MSTFVHAERLRELSLFSGAGGGILASTLLGWKTLGYVEWDKYCQDIIKARIADGIFPDAPIFGDIRSFSGTPWRGHIDVISAGFP